MDSLNRQLEFVDKSMYRGKRLILELVDIKSDGSYVVEISDFTVKNGATQHDWCPPRFYTNLSNGNVVHSEGTGNPKYKEYTKDEFDKLYKIGEIQPKKWINKWQ